MARFLNISALIGAGLCALQLGAAPVAAQTPTGAISGRVVDAIGHPVPDVEVRAESPGLQQAQRTATSSNGDYIFRLLPPGTYPLTFTRPGFRVETGTREVAITEAVTLDVVLEPATVQETVTVTDGTTTFLEGTASAVALPLPLLSTLPTARTIRSAVNLAPNVHGTGPLGDFSISGAMAFESVFKVNGVQIQDNLFGSPLPLFIEDAIDQTTVTTSAIAADEGRFSGGVVNVVTKSGGNTLSGSVRFGLTNDDWRTSTPFGEPRLDRTVPTYEVTLGGPIVPAHTWFFGAGRLFEEKTAELTTVTEIPYTATVNEKRFEGKLTQAIGPRQRLQVAFTGVEKREDNYAETLVMDLASLENRRIPDTLLAVHYAGSVGPRFFLEGQYSARTSTFKNSGSRFTDPINGTHMLDQLNGTTWWSPFGCAVCQEEERDNTEAAFKGSYLFSTRAGAHNVSFGYSLFNDQLVRANHQSGSDRWILTTGSFFDGTTVYPVIEGGPFNFSTLIVEWPIQEPARRTAFRTHGLFLQDTWAVNPHLSLNLGVRYDRNDGKNASGDRVTAGAAVSPRVSVAWDLRGNGRTVLSAGAGRYTAAVSSSIANSTTPATPSIFVYAYEGPSINVDETEPLVTTDVAIAQVLGWLESEPFPFLLQATIPGVETQIREPLRSPSSEEFTVGLSQLFGSRVALRVDVLQREFKDLYAVKADGSTGFVTDDQDNLYDLKLLVNTNALKRRYRALSTQLDVRLGALGVGGNYTLSELRGNAEGESLDGPLTGGILRYPEYFDPAWSFPTGDLSADQRHRARLWAVWNIFDDLSLSALQQIESGLPYGAVGNIDSSPYVTSAPDYAQPPAGMIEYYFTPRDEFRTDWTIRTDLAVTYDRRVGGSHGPELFAQVQLLNAFNQFGAFNLTGGEINRRTLTAVDDPDRFAPFDPFLETPIEGVHWAKGSRFGQVVHQRAYTAPREFRVSLGLRF